MPKSCRDTDWLASKDFRAEGALLLDADRAAHILETRMGRQRTAAVVFSLEEAKELTRTFRNVLEVAKAYHVGAAECGQ